MKQIIEIYEGHTSLSSRKVNWYRKALGLEPLPARRRRKHTVQQKQNVSKDVSNLISSTAVGQPTYKLGVHRTVERIPFIGEPTRNLIYHIYPKKCGDVWRWNLDQLLKYIDIFNGRRIVAIAVDGSSESAETIEDYLAGKVIEFMVYRNNSNAGEMVSFLPLLAQVESNDTQQITFRAHAKGVIRQCKERKKAELVRNWTEMLYRTSLTTTEKVAQHLESAAMTGSCRKFNQFDKKSRKPTYSGSFYWFRNCFVFSREWYRVDGPRWGCESWPGKMFKPEETRCLFNDNTGSMYSPEYWRDKVGPAYDAWRHTNHTDR